MSPLPLTDLDYGRVVLWDRSDCPSAEDAIRADAEYSGYSADMESHVHLSIVWATEWLNGCGDYLSGDGDPHTDVYAVFGGQPAFIECWELRW